MSNYLDINPQTEDYMRPSAIFQNLTYNTENVTLATDISDTATPFLALDGQGIAYLQGQVTINTASVSANMPLCTFPDKIVPARDTWHPVVVLRSGAYVANAVKVDQSSQNVVLLTQPQQNDVVALDSVSFLVKSYN